MKLREIKTKGAVATRIFMLSKKIWSHCSDQSARRYNVQYCRIVTLLHDNVDNSSCYMHRYRHLYGPSAVPNSVGHRTPRRVGQLVGGVLHRRSHLLHWKHAATGGSTMGVQSLGTPDQGRKQEYGIMVV